jgi:parallel beta-helix repeat protein
MRKIFLMTAIVATFLMVLGLASAQAATFLVNDATGGDCSDIGVWDDLTATCTMNVDTNETIVIQASGSGLTLDCDGFTIEGDGSGQGITAVSADKITIKNCTVINFGIGINVHTVTNSIVRDNTLGSATVAIWLNLSSSNRINDNRLNDNPNGILVQVSSNNNIVRDNDLDGPFACTNGIRVDHSVDNVFLGNTVRNLDCVSISVGIGADRTIVDRNVVDSTRLGINLDGDTDGVEVLKNNVMNVTSAGINVPHGQNTLVQGNVINGALHGIGIGGLAQGAIVNKNTIRKTTFTGIFVFGSGHTFRANDVDGASNFGLSLATTATGLVFEKGNTFCNSGTSDIHDGGIDHTWNKTTCDTILGGGNAVCTKVCK